MDGGAWGRLPGWLAFLLGLSFSLASPVGAVGYVVGLVASDDLALPRPVSRDQRLREKDLLAMVRRSVELVGGMASVVPDTARLVVIKPNIAIASPPGKGIVTDPALVGAVALLVHEAAPGARILIAEGAGGWKFPPPTKDPGIEAWLDQFTGIETEDGFATAGYRRLVEKLQRRGIQAECFDLNFDRSRELAAPSGGQGADRYFLPVTLLEADAWINCPVAKTHGPRITVSLKNHLGLLPGLVYGWPKSRGTENHPGIPHQCAILEEVMIDLWQLTQVDLNVVDGTVGHEGGALWYGEPVRTNWVLASRNPVAADLVAAKLMGFNPDDMEFAELAWRQGLGPRFYEEIEVRGDPVERLSRRFKKAVESYGLREEWRYVAGYGMGPRYWTLLGPLPADHRFSPSELANLKPVPGKEGWSPVIFFHHDEIDLRPHFAGRSSGALYAFTYFTMAQDDSVRFWAGSDEGMEVWIDGIPIYQHQGLRRHYLGQDQVPGYLEAGVHCLLVRVEQRRGPCEFSFNICEPIDDPLYAGNRYPGVRYFVEKP